jgi:hypothetical protein
LRIRINILDRDSIDNAIKRVKDYRNSLDSKVNEIVSRLAVLGMQVVEYQYNSSEDYAVYEVSCITNGDSSMIIAEGSDVMFLEFGAGTKTSDYTYETESEGLPPIFPGSYSQTEGKGQFRPGHEYWYYERRRYTSLEPCLGFYFASKEIKEQAVDIATKVFKK